MKKMIAILLSVLTLFAVCACSKDEPRTETKTDDYTPDYGELYYASVRHHGSCRGSAQCTRRAC